MHFDAHVRSIAKAVSYRTAASVTTAAVVFALTGKLSLAALAGGIDIVGKIGLYYLHERAWDRIQAGKLQPRPAVVWLTGLPAAGKTTLARLVTADLAARGYEVEHLDGDAVRKLFPSTGFAREERERHIERVGHLASVLERHGVIVIASLVSPYAATRDSVRALCKRFIEVHVATPLEECERRDPIGLYARARRGEITGVTGVDAPYEPPPHPELRIDTREMPAEEAAASIVARVLTRRRSIDSQPPVPRAARSPLSLDMQGERDPARAAARVVDDGPQGLGPDARGECVADGRR
jgi:adenylylsulfate kinase